MNKISLFVTASLCSILVFFLGCRKEPVQVTDPTPPVGTTGQVMFWTVSDLGCGSITVTCNGVNRTLSSYFSNGVPACGASGSATFDFTPGTYSYSAQCSGKTWSGTVTVAAGGCNKIQLTSGNTPSTTGQAMFWAASDLGCGSITVNCNGQSRALSSYYSAVPACGANGAATFDLAPGNYSYSAQCSGKTWSGIVAVTSAGCSKVQLTATTGGSTTGQAMFWTASDLGCGSITVVCNGISRVVSGYQGSSVPACGASGAATFDIAPGTYSYSAQCSGKTWSGSVTVTTGGCSRVQFTSTSGSTTTGEGMFWTASDLGCGTITVTCNGVSRNIASYYSSGAPACGANGCATYALNPGTYAYTAKCTSKTWSGSINITSNGCSRLQLTR